MTLTAPAAHVINRAARAARIQTRASLMRVSPTRVPLMQDRHRRAPRAAVAPLRAASSPRECACSVSTTLSAVAEAACAISRRIAVSWLPVMEACA